MFSFRKNKEIRRAEKPSYDDFLAGLSGCMEYLFTYKNHSIDVAFHYEGDRKIYELNIDGYDENARRLSFLTIEELAACTILENKSLRDLWNDLET